jgi:tetratricopeptide (TPR) repeat protein
MGQRLLMLVLAVGPLSALRAQDSPSLAQTGVEAERRGDFKTAISTFEQLIRNGTDTPDLRNNLGIAYFQLNRYQEALAQFRRALTSNPASLPANLFSGLSLLKLGRAVEAQLLLQKALRLHPGDTQITLALAQASLGAKKIILARDQYQEAAQLQPDNAEAWYGVGITDRVLAEEESQRARNARTASNQAALGRARSLLHDSEQAIAKATQLDPSSVRSHMIFGEALRIAERYPEAVREYEAATVQAPNEAAVWAGLAVAYSAAGDDEKALHAGKRALELDARDAGIMALIAGTCLRQGNTSEAETYAQRALALEPVSAAHVVLGKVYAGRHEYAKALPELKAAAPEDADGSINYLLATTLRQLGNTSEAAVAMQRYRTLHARALSGAR